MQIWYHISFKIFKKKIVLSSISCIKLLVDFYTLLIKMNYLGHNAESTLVSIMLHARNDRFGIQKYMLGQSEHLCSLDYNIIGRRKDVQIHNYNYVFTSAKLRDEWLLSHHQIIPTVTILGADRNRPPVSVISASDIDRNLKTNKSTSWASNDVHSCDFQWVAHARWQQKQIKISGTKLSGRSNPVISPRFLWRSTTI